MKKLSIDNLMSKLNNKFIIVNAVIMRAKQISDGSLPYIDSFDPTNPITTALKEIVADRILIKKSKKTAKELEVVKAEEKPKAKLSLIKETKSKKKKK